MGMVRVKLHCGAKVTPTRLRESLINVLCCSSILLYQICGIITLSADLPYTLQRDNNYTLPPSEIFQITKYIH